MSVRGTGEIESAAAKADFTLSVTIQQSSAAGAAAESARIAKAVTEALGQVGLPKDAIKSSHLTVGPVWSYASLSSKRTRSGFSAVTTLSIETTNLSELGYYLDAALNAGATEVSSISFSVADPEAVRGEALALAVRNARRDAEAIAKAAGGSLVQVVDLSTESAPDRFVRANANFAGAAAAPAASQAANTTIVIPVITTSASVVAVWQFQAA